MKLEQSFEVSAPLERVWNALIDVEHVAPCLPGATVTGRNEDGSYTGTFTVKIGPTTATYAGKLEMHEIDATARTATMHAHGTDKRGQGGANATIKSRLTESGGVTHVALDTDYHITGRLARFGRGGMIEDISRRMLRDFAQRLQESLVQEDGGGGAGAAPPVAAEPDAAGEPEPEPVAAGPANDPPQPPPAQPPRAPPAPREPVDGLSLVSSVIATRIQRNPLPFAVGLLVALILLWRRKPHDRSA